MKYLPFENITYSTKLDSEEICKRLSDIIQPKRSFNLFGNSSSESSKPYEGSIDKNSFQISRIIGYRNSFLPIIKGSIQKDFNGTKIQVKMRIHKFVTFFMAFWMGGVSLGCLASLTMFSKDDNFNPVVLIPFFMLLFGYGLVTGGFKYESIKSRKYFEELLEASIEKQ